MRESTLLYLTQVDVNRLNLRIELHILHINHLKRFTEAHHSDIAILQIDHLISIFDDRTRIRAKEELSILADTHNKWTLLTSGNDLIRIALIEKSDGIGTNHLTKSYLNSSQQVQVFLHLNIFNQLNEHLSIGITFEGNAFGNQVFLDVGIVLDDTIMDDCKILGRRIMRMSIHCRRFTMSSPTSMGDTY